ncbi:MAG: xanthine dehydrogenase family protein molybdopterin-binding subunit [Alphaproteobacteria bacterium]
MPDVTPGNAELPADRQGDDVRFLTGRGRYLGDLTMPGLGHAVVLRSPVAHGRIVRLDAGAARAMPGVRDVIAGAEIRAAGLGAMPCLGEPAGFLPYRLQVPAKTVLAVDRVRHVGEAVAMVVADTVEQARDGAAAIALDIEPLGVAATPADAVAPGAPLLWPDIADNVALDWRAGDAEAVAAAFAGAAHVTRLRLVNNRVAMVPMEARGALGAYDSGSGRYALHAPTQGVHRIRRIAAGILGVPAEAVRVITDDVGGAFGLKGMGFPEHALVLLAAARTGRPVRWLAERTEGFVCDTAGRDHVTEVALALDEAGRMLALSVDSLANMGAYLSTMAPNIATKVFGRVMGGVYRIPALHLRVRCVLTNTPPVDAYRGAGVPEAIYAVERAVDVAAQETGVDPLDLRRRNMLAPADFPWRLPTGYAIDSGDFRGALDRALEVADWAGFDGRRRESAARGLRRGRGLAVYIHGTGGGTNELSRVTVRADGRITVATGVQSGGQGHAAMLAEIVAEALDVDAARIAVLQGDSDLLPQGGGTGGSGSLIVAGRAAAAAAGVLIETARALAADRLEVAAADVAYAAGRFRVAGTDLSLRLEEVAAGAPEESCSGEAGFAGDHRTFPNGVYVCEVEVDPDTGHVAIDRFTCVDDIGRILDPARADGQVHGAVAQGIGQALMEHERYDPVSGQPQTGSLLDYALPRAADLPSFALAKRPTPAPSNPQGFKGVGETGTAGAPPAVVAAVCDAIGVAHIDMPVTAEKVWRALNGG